MSEGKPQHQKLPTDIAQIPIVWRYELLKYLRSKRLLASIVISFVVIALIYILPPALGSPYSGTETDSSVTMVDLQSLGLQPGFLPYDSVGLLNKTGVHLGSLKVYLNGTEYPSGPSTWVISGKDGAPKIDVPGAAVILLFSQNVSGDRITASYDWSMATQDFDGLFLNFASILIVICATFFGADALVGEFQNRTGYLIFPNPVKKEVIFFGKYVASITAGIIVVGIFYMSVTALSFFTVGALDDDFGLSFGFSIEYLLAAMAVAYVISSLLKGTTGATVLTFFMFIMILPIVDSVSMFSGVKIAGSLTFEAGVIQYIIQDPYPTSTVQDVGGFSFNNFFPDPTTAAITMFVYVVAAIAVSLVVFKRKQLAG